MATVLGVPTRFGGELTINRSDVKSIQTSEGLNSVGMRLQHIWDRIKDWFCNTNLVEAKQQLSVLYSPDASTSEKADSYFKLMDLVGEGYRDRFKVQPEAFGFSTSINYGDGVTPYSQSIVLCNRDYLLTQLEADIAKASAKPDLLALYQRELARDLPRATFSIDGKSINGLGPMSDGGPGSLERFHAALAESLSPTNMQLLAIDTISYQKIFALVMAASLDTNGGVFTDDLIHIKGDGTSIFDLTAKGDDIELHVNFTSEWRSGIPGRSYLLQSPCYDARVLIGPAGNVTLLSAVSGAAPISS